MAEILAHGAIDGSATGKPRDRIVSFAPATSHATLGSFFGTHLPDPDPRLVGERARMPRVRVRSAVEAADPRDAALVGPAGPGAAANFARLRAKRSAPQRRATRTPGAARAAR